MSEYQSEAKYKLTSRFSVISANRRYSSKLSTTYISKKFNSYRILAYSYVDNPAIDKAYTPNNSTTTKHIHQITSQRQSIYTK